MWPNATVLRLSRFFTHNTRIPNSFHHIFSHLNQHLLHIHSDFWQLPTIMCPHYISIKGLSQNLPWHISHTSQYRIFSSRCISAHIWQCWLFQSHRISTLLKIQLSQATSYWQVVSRGTWFECLHYIRTFDRFPASFLQASSWLWRN